MLLNEVGTGVTRSSFNGVDVWDLPMVGVPDSLELDMDGSKDWQVLGHSPLIIQ